MSRSYRQPVEKVKQPQAPRRYNRQAKVCWRRLTRCAKTMTEDELDRLEFPSKNAFMDMWEFCDYKLVFIGKKLKSWHEDWRRRITRK